MPLDNESDAKKVLRLVDLLEDLDDVQNVYANFDIPDSILELVEAVAGPRRPAIHRRPASAAIVERVFALGVDPGLSRCGYGVVGRTRDGLWRCRRPA